MMKIADEIKQSSFRSNYQELYINLLYTSSFLRAEANKLFKSYNLSEQQYNILRILRGQYPKAATVNLLIDRMLDKMSNASRLVEKLFQKNLVQRTQCSFDRRRVDVKITKKGLDLLDKLEKPVNEFEEQLKILNLEEVAELNQTLDKIRASYRKDHHQQEKGA